jgi:asparagine synthase (glutamine-hydrolysing)
MGIGPDRVCGIAGIFDRGGTRPHDAALLGRMLELLAHRGPDEQAEHLSTNICLGARRLAIIDLETGSQPVTNEDGSIVATQNGEIYNYVELREELIRSGHQLRSRGDTETIVHLYERHGERFVDHLHGMFAIALVDQRSGRLVLARDRLGKKPLYWRRDGDRLIWGSELKALLADSSIERRIDRDALAHYLQYQYVPSPMTILSGFHKLPPGTVLFWDGGEPRIEQYWSISTAASTDRIAFADAVDATLERLRAAVRLRLRSDVPVGIFLSGGLDSTTVAALMAEASEQPIRTYTIGFHESGYDERAAARATARHLGAVHTEEVLQLDAMKLLPELARQFDEPFGDSSALPTLEVARIAARDLKVVLTGDGGDETFAGYTRYLDPRPALARLPAPIARSLAAVAERSAARILPGTSIARRSRTLRRTVTQDRIGRHIDRMTVLPFELRAELLQSRAEADRDAFLRDAMPSGETDVMRMLLLLDLTTYLPEDLLVKMDRATMAHSLEARSPLLDQSVVEFANTLPTSFKIRGRKTKIVLRTAARRILPAELVDRPKRGFSVPVGRWFRGELGEAFTDWVLGPDGQTRDHLDIRPVTRMLADHRAGRIDHGRELWVVLAFELWARSWMRPTVAESA